mmetsp:Transcript_66291/g.156557  ORF Transcript_66291/g.156557 Transcript_66291/m.156557 type:complete len:232 (+) Transcript_66291:353-1048(+)
MQMPPATRLCTPLPLRDRAKPQSFLLKSGLRLATFETRMGKRRTRLRRATPNATLRALVKRRHSHRQANHHFRWWTTPSQIQSMGSIWSSGTNQRYSVWAETERIQSFYMCYKPPIPGAPKPPKPPLLASLKCWLPLNSEYNVKRTCSDSIKLVWTLQTRRMCEVHVMGMCECENCWRETHGMSRRAQMMRVYAVMSTSSSAVGSCSSPIASSSSWGQTCIRASMSGIGLV